MRTTISFEALNPIFSWSAAPLRASETMALGTVYDNCAQSRRTMRVFQLVRKRAQISGMHGPDHWRRAGKARHHATDQIGVIEPRLHDMWTKFGG